MSLKLEEQLAQQTGSSSWHKQIDFHVLGGFERHCEPGMLEEVRDVIIIP